MDCAREGGKSGHFRQNQGFTLIELMIAVAVFTIMAGAAFTLFDQQVQLSTRQQNLSGVNIGMRNAMAQLEMDLAGASQNLLSSVPLSANGAVQPMTLGVIVQNNPPGGAGVTACTPNTTTWAYPIPSACYDSLTVIQPKPCNVAGCPSTNFVQVLLISDTSDNLNTTTTINATDPNPTGVAATDATFYKQGDELLIVTPPTNSLDATAHCPSNGVSTTSQSAFCMTTVTLTANASVAGANIVLTHSLTGANGQPVGCPSSSCTDPLGLIYSSAHTSQYNYALALSPGPYGGTNAAGSYVINLGSGLNDVWYTVVTNPNNTNDAQLMRCQGGPCTATNEQTLTDQVIGFKAGAILWGNQNTYTTDIGSYFFNAANYCNDALSGATCNTAPTANDPYDYSLVQALRISMLARTTPLSDPTLFSFTNQFDGGHYLVQQASVVVDLRSISSTHFGN